jgi:hypothetical protein
MVMMMMMMRRRRRRRRRRMVTSDIGIYMFSICMLIGWRSFSAKLFWSLWENSIMCVLPW